MDIKRRDIVLFVSLLCSMELHAIDSENRPNGHSPSLSRRLISMITPPSSPQPLRRVRSRSLGQADVTIRFSETAEPLSNDNQEEHLLFFDAIQTFVRHRDRTIIVQPKDTPQNPSDIQEMLDRDLGDVSGSAAYDKLKGNKEYVQANSQLVYKAVIAQSVRQRLKKYCTLLGNLQDLQVSSNELLTLIDEPPFQDSYQVLEMLSKALSKVNDNDFCKNKARDLEKQLLEQSIKPFDKLLRTRCILTPCNTPVDPAYQE